MTRCKCFTDNALKGAILAVNPRTDYPRIECGRAGSRFSVEQR